MAKKIPLRKCIACNGMFDKRDLIRIVKKPDNSFALDRTNRMNGRGAYICDKNDCMEKAIKHKRIERSFSCQVPNSIYEDLRKAMDKNG